MSSVKTLIVGVLLLWVAVLPSAAQTGGEESQYVHEYARRGRLTITVYIWGNVNMPGIWKVEPETDLIELLSAARVSGFGVEESSTSQKVFLRIYRQERGQRTQIFNEQLDHILEAGSRYPTLQEGDILEVVSQRRSKLGFQTVAQVIGAVSSLSLLIIRLSNF